SARANKARPLPKQLLSVLRLSSSFPPAAVAQTAGGEAGTTITNPATSTDQNTQDGQNAQDGLDHAADASATTAGPFVTVPETGAWRVSDFEGKAVYGADGETIGEVNDLLVSRNASVKAVIIGVGGLRGFGVTAGHA